MHDRKGSNQGSLDRTEAHRNPRSIALERAEMARSVWLMRARLVLGVVQEYSVGQ